MAAKEALNDVGQERVARRLRADSEIMAVHCIRVVAAYQEQKAARMAVK